MDHLNLLGNKDSAQSRIDRYNANLKDLRPLTGELKTPVLIISNLENSKLEPASKKAICRNIFDKEKRCELIDIIVKMRKRLDLETKDQIETTQLLVCNDKKKLTGKIQLRWGQDRESLINFKKKTD